MSSQSLSLELPTDGRRRARPSSRFAFVERALDEAFSTRLRAAAAGSDLTLFALVEGTLHALLHRYTGQAELATGRLGAEGLVAIRSVVADDTTLGALVRGTRDARPAATDGERPQVTLVDAEVVGEPGALATEWLVTLRDDGARVALRIDYAAELFEHATIERVLVHFENLLRATSDDSERSAREVDFLATEERTHLLETWNATSVPLPPLLCVHHLFEQQASRTPDAPAVVFGERSLTYVELERRADALARTLVTLGVGPDVHVGLCVERSIEMAIGVLAILKAGGAYVPMDPAYPKDRLAFMLADTRAPVLLTETSLADVLPAHDARVLLLDEEPAHAPGEPVRASVRPEHLAYVIYTSGSTGRPKGICLGHEALVNLLRWHDRTLLRGARTLQFASLSFDASFHEMFAAWMSGGTVYLITEAVRRDVIALTHFVEKHAIEKAILPVVVLQQMAEHFGDEPERFRSLREVTTTGEQLHVTTPIVRLAKQLPDCTFHNHYGPSETHVVTALTLPRDPESWPSHPSIGRPIDNTQLYILDRHGNPVPRGVVGELYLGGVCLARGYHGRPDLTDERFVRNPFGSSDAKIYKTGDLARYLPDGNVEFLGRIDHQVKIRGFRVELGEIEGTLGEHPLVKEAVVLAREDEPGDRRLVAYVVAERGEPRTETRKRAPVTTSLREHLRDRLPDFMLPSAIVLVDVMPLTPNGKVDRRALPAPGTARPELREAFVAPRTPTEEGVAAIFREALRLDRVGVVDNFFELGGDSLRAVQVFARVRSRFGVELAFQELFARPTVASLSTCIESTAKSPLAPIERTERGRDLPLSFAQERLWFLEQLAPESAAYNCPYAFRIRGALDREALVASVQALVDRHEILRTSFVAIEGRPFQRIHDTRVVPFETVDLAHVGEAEQERALRVTLEDRLGRPFDFVHDPLVRAGLVRLAETDHVFFLDVHHIVTDGRSMEVVFRELAELYGSARERRASAFAPLELEYADFSVWQREALTEERLSRTTAWWKERLDGAPPLLELPTDFARPPSQTFRGEALSFALDRDVTDALRALGAEHNMTLVMVVLAGYATVLHRYSGQDDVLVGIPTLGRDRVELESLIGFFVNTLPIRLDFSSAPSFEALLEQVRRVSLDAFEHDDVPFERLVHDLSIERSASYNPIVQVAIAPQPPLERTLSLSGATVEHVDVDARRSAFDMTLFCWDTAEGLSVTVEYATTLFERATIERLGTHLTTLLTAAASTPDASVTRLPLLTPAERERVLVAWNDTGVPVPTDECFHERFAAQAVRTPDAIAVEEPSGRALTYAELDSRSNQLARHLLELGVRPDRLVALCVDRSVELVVGVLGILKAGGAYVPLDPTYPRDRLEFMLADAAPIALVTEAHLESLLPESTARRVRLDADAEAIARLASTPVQKTSTATDLAYVIYTSGSTGRPKGAALEHRSLVNMAEAQRIALAMTADARVLQFASLSFDAAVWEMAATLTVGATLCMLPKGRPLLGPALGRFLRDRRITVATLPPSVLPDVSPELAASVGTLVVAGEACSADLVATWAPARRFINAYGPTECTVCATLTVCEPDGRAPSIGRPLANVRTYVLDAERMPVPVGVPGELYVGGRGVGRGYVGRPELTRERFLADPFSSEPSARMYRTGDRVRFRHDGSIEFLGRTDFQVKLRGFRIELGEIEEALREGDDVHDAVVVARGGDSGEPRLVAYVVPRAGDGELSSHVASWRSLYDGIFETAEAVEDAGSNFTGWNSSYTGKPLPVREMQAWRSNTVERILALRPTDVWEIGCGTGLLLLPIAPACSSYRGTDISKEELALLGQAVGALALSHVKLELRRADDRNGIERGSVDTVVVNSVIQYFPDVHYLRNVLAGAIATVRPGGAIFVGDVRHFGLLDAFRTNIELSRVTPATPASTVRELVARAIATEPELLVDPEAFLSLADAHPEIAHVEVTLKRGRDDNELTSYRYDVVLHVGEREAPIVPARSSALAALGGTLRAVERWLCDGAPSIAELIGVPNARVLGALESSRRLASSDASAGELASVVDEALHPEDFWELAERFGYSARITWSRSMGPGGFDVLFERPSSRRRPWHPPAASITTTGRDVANAPLELALGRSLPAKLRERLERRLPAYMVPSEFVTLRSLPLTPAGKVDRKALPASGDSPKAERRGFVAPRDELERTIASLWAELLGVERVGIDDDFFDLGGHSLLVSRVIFRIHDAIGVEIPMRAMYEAPTIAQISSLIERTKIDPTFERLCYSPDLVLEDEALLDPGIRPPANAVDTSRPAHHVLLTGATGFVGGHLLAELLTTTDARIHCLVRAKSVAHALERLVESLSAYPLAAANVRSRVEVILGDLASPRLGLDEAAFDRLGETLDAIYHNGALVDHVRGYAHMKPANVQGTHEILRLACVGRLKPVHFVSTLGVVYPPDYVSDGIVREDAVAGPLGRLPNGYMQSKCVAESLVTQAMARGVPASIYRLGAVSGHTRTGHCNPGDFTYSAIRSTIELGFADNLDTDLTLTPIDFVARALVSLMRRPASLGKVHHVTNPKAFFWLDLIAYLNARGFEIRVVGYAECMDGLVDAARRGIDTPMLAFLPFVTQRLPGTTRYVAEDYHAPVRWDCENMLAGLTDAGVAPPPAPSDILEIYISYLNGNRLLKTKRGDC